jgi:GAF domain-containing protein
MLVPGTLTVKMTVNIREAVSRTIQINSLEGLLMIEWEAAMDQAMCAFVPREERFDRITRTVRRLLDVPIALISVVEHDAQWFRSAQGLAEVETPRNISFCGHAVASGKALAVPDATNDPRFWDNPLVTGSPYIRSYLGIPLSIAPGVRVGTLCALDNQVRSFTQQDILGMEDLAAMAEAELRLDAMGTTQRQLMAALGQAERRTSMDPATGCWNARGFRELVTMTVGRTAPIRGRPRHCATCGCATMRL